MLLAAMERVRRTINAVKDEGRWIREVDPRLAELTAARIRLTAVAAGAAAQRPRRLPRLLSIIAD